jgi:alpha-1,2-mannosyltransferase
MLEAFRRVSDRQWQRLTVGLAAVIVIARFIPLIHENKGDFDLHYGLAQRLVSGEFLYGPGFDRVYPPAWALFHAPCTLVSYHAALLLLFPAGVAAMIGLVWLLKRLADQHWPLQQSPLFWSSALAILFASPFLHRDLVEIGVNTFLVFLTWLGIYLWSKNNDALGSIPLGAAAALKCTPVAFILYFFWKRQWKFAIGSTAMAIFFTVLPISVMGTHNYIAAERYWFKDVVGGVSDPDPSRTVLGPDRIGNLSLRTALARYLIHLPYGNPGRPETPVDSLIPNEPPEKLYFDVITLPPATAGKIVKIILLAIAAATAWIFRHRVRDRNDERVLWECAALGVASLLYSPLTWAQHCTAVLPAFYFMFRAAFAGRTLPRFVPTVLIYFFLVICLLERGLIGSRAAGLLDAYHLRNFALLGLFWATLRCRGITGTTSIDGHQVERPRINDAFAATVSPA